MKDNLNSRNLVKLEISSCFTKDLMNALPSTRRLNKEDDSPYFYMTEDDIQLLKQKIQLNSQSLDKNYNQVFDSIISRYNFSNHPSE